MNQTNGSPIRNSKIKQCNGANVSLNIITTMNVKTNLVRIPFFSVFYGNDPPFRVTTMNVKTEVECVMDTNFYNFNLI